MLLTLSDVMPTSYTRFIVSFNKKMHAKMLL